MPLPPDPAPAPVSPEPALPRRRPRRGRRGAELLLVVVLALAVVVPVRAFVVSPVRIASGSMTPTLQAGDVVLVDRRGVDLAALERGDLVTFRRPGSGEETLKRVVGLPGDTVVVLDAVLHVNGHPVDEPYVDFTEWDGMFTAQVEVPAGAVYVLGDNRVASVDSRDHGPVPAADLDGRVLLGLWPPAHL